MSNEQLEAKHATFAESIAAILYEVRMRHAEIDAKADCAETNQSLLSQAFGKSSYCPIPQGKLGRSNGGISL